MSIESARQYQKKIDELNHRVEDLLDLITVLKKDRKKYKAVVDRLKSKIQECKENAGGMEFGMALQEILDEKPKSIEQRNKKEGRDMMLND